MIVFYDKTDENIEYIFDNLCEILRFMKKPINDKNKNYINVMIYRALRTKTHFVRFLTNEILTVHLIDLKEDEELCQNKQNLM